MARLSVKEAAAYVPVAKGTLDKLRILGGGPRFIKIGKKVLYDMTDLDAWIEEHKQANTADKPPEGRRRKPR
jgi:excisionase family DNA binding protein